MEATLQKHKSKKHRMKSKQMPSIALDIVQNTSSCDNDLKTENLLNDNEKQSEMKLEENKSHDSELPVSVEKEHSTESLCKNVVENCSNKTTVDENLELLSTSAVQSPSKEVCDNFNSDISSQVKSSNVCIYMPVNSVMSEKTSLKLQQDIAKSQSLHVYPDLKSLQLYEEMHNIISSQTLVKTSAEAFKTKAIVEANLAFEEFVKVTHDLDKHPLTDLVHDYHRSKTSSVQWRSKIKYLKSNLKRKKDSLWRTVQRQASTKGKCEDGNSVNVIHSYTIKQLDEDKFEEVKNILKEIEELLFKEAFYSYSEEITRLRIDNYLYELLENEKEQSFDKNLSYDLPKQNSTSLKECISVLFNSQRQNVNDKQYLHTCRNWLKTLVSKLIQNRSFEDNFFVINQVIRCPNGIENWASQLIQIPIDITDSEKKETLDSICAKQILLALFVVLNPVPLKEYFLKNIKERDLPLTEDAKFTILDSEGEEEELLEISRNFSETDILSLLNQVPVRSLYKHFLLDTIDNYGNVAVKVYSEERLLKLFSYSTAIIDVLFEGLDTYYSANFHLLFESISNLIRHILLYISKYWTHHVNLNNHFKSEIQAVYDKLFFHIVFKVYNFEKIHIWKILPALPYEHISEKMLWNIMWIFFSPGKPEENLYSEKDVELKIKDESVLMLLIGHIKNLPQQEIFQLLNAIEKMVISRNSWEKDFIRFSYHVILMVTVFEDSLRKLIFREGIIILRSMTDCYPYLVSLLLKEIRERENFENFAEIVEHCIILTKKMDLRKWIPNENDICILSSWLMSNLSCGKNHFARLILMSLNWDYNNEGSLFLPYDLHKQIAVIVCEAYVKFDADNINEGLVSKGVKQMLQFTSIMGQREEEKFVNWAWSILFSLKLHPLDQKYPPWIQVYDGFVEDYDKLDFNNDLFHPLLSAYENKHPSGCYLMLTLTNDGYSIKNLLSKGLECFANLVYCEQYIAAIKSLYYILPFFVKHSEELLENFGFMKAMNNLITADLTVMSNITGEPIIGAVLHKIAAIIKYQIFQAAELTIEYAAPLIKLWVQILMKMLMPSENNTANKNTAKQVHFLLDVLVKISFLDDYTRECMLDHLNGYCNILKLPKERASQTSFWYRFFSSTSSVYVLLNRDTIPEYPWLGWYVLYSEMKQKDVEDLWLKVQTEMTKQGETISCLKKISHTTKIEAECLPIYRWALQAVGTPVSHPVLPLIWQQFFLHYFERVPLSNSLPENKHDAYARNGIKFFNSGHFLTLFKKMQKHLANTETHYRDLLKKLESEDKCASEISSKSKNGKENGLLFYSNLLKIFGAFKLWIDNESLLQSGLCLSALEPKYCPYRLELILNGDKSIWFDLVSCVYLKEELDQKIHSWCFSKKTEPEALFPSSRVKENEESLPDQLRRHIEKYECVLPAVRTEPLSAVVFEQNNSVFTSVEAMMHMIKQNESVIFDKAHYFCEQMRKLKQLNFNYINWTPQEYDIEDCQVVEKKACHKGNGCSGSAYFKLQIQKCKRNERISERIDNNRSEYLIVQDLLSKLNVNDLCMSSLYIENCIRSLANKIKEANGKDSDSLKNMGITLFYHEMDEIDKTISRVADYPPADQFFSLIIESLGREFIDGNEAELSRLVEAILNHDKSGTLALPLFNPGKASIENFISMYKTLASSVGKHSTSTVLALFSKINFSQWLNEQAPSCDHRKEIFENICNGLVTCGQNPSKELHPVFEILKKHFGVILQYMFPDLFLTSIIFLLKGVEDKSISVDVYYEAFSCFGCPSFDDKNSVEDIEFSLRKFAKNQQLPADQQMFVSVAKLNLHQVSYVSRLLYSHYSQKRLNTMLYKEYNAFIKPLGIFLAIISHSLVALHLDEILLTNESLNVSELWNTFQLPFLPWLHPVKIGVNSSLDFPWTNEDVNHAHYMFQIFTVALKYFHEEILTFKSEECVLSFVWRSYVETYVTPGIRHYSMSVCHTELLNLPWHQFHPDSEDIEGMCKVLQSNLHESKEFLSKISLKIPWLDVMKVISLTKSPDYVGKVLATLGKLLIISQLDCVAAETDRSKADKAYSNVFKDMENLSWQLLSIGEIELLLNVFYSGIDSFSLFNNWTTGVEFYVLQFLKHICCMIPSPDADDFSNSKRCLYLKHFICALCECCSSKKTEMLTTLSAFKDIISSLFDEINAVISNGTNPSKQTNYALPLIQEVVTCLNSLPEGQLSAAALCSITSWISVNKKSPLLLPCLKISCEKLNCVSHIAPLAECCIATRFSNETLDVHETQRIWQLISSYFSVRSNLFDEFVKKCVEENTFLTLHCCILHQLSHTNSIEAKKVLLSRILQWIKDSKLRRDSEAKIILMWDRLLELSIKLIFEQEWQVAKQELTSFCWILETLAEDRSSSGFFSLIGLGQASALSVSFRFLCRVMIAFIQFQIPVNHPIQIEPTDMNNLDSSSTCDKANGKRSSVSSYESSASVSASRAIENLKSLHQKKLYSALESQIDHAIKMVLDSKYTILESRELLKYFAVVLYPKDSYLSALAT